MRLLHGLLILHPALHCFQTSLLLVNMASFRMRYLLASRAYQCVSIFSP